MFAFIPGIGGQELLLLLLLGSGMLAAVAVVAVVVVRIGGRGRVGELEAENRRLRDELDRERGRG